MPAFIAYPALLNAQPQEQATEIVERSIDNLKRDWAAEPHFDCSERDKDKNGTRTYQDIMLYGSQYQKLIALNDKTLDAHQQAEQEQKFQAVVSNRQVETDSQKRQRIAKYAAQRKHATQLILELTKAFSFSIAGTGKLGAHEVYVLNAEPRRGYVPPNIDTRVLTGMHGKLWIDRASFQWVRVDVQVFRPVSIAGFIARVEPGTRFELEQEPVAADIWLPSHFAVRSLSKVVFLFNRQTDEDDTYFDYHPVQNPSASSGLPQSFPGMAKRSVRAPSQTAILNGMAVCSRKTIFSSLRRRCPGNSSAEERSGANRREVGREPIECI